MVQENAVSIFKKVETKWISQNTLSETAALTLNNLIWSLKQLQSRQKLCKKHTLKNFAAKWCTNYQLLVNLFIQLHMSAAFHCIGLRMCSNVFQK